MKCGTMTGVTMTGGIITLVFIGFYSNLLAVSKDGLT